MDGVQLPQGYSHFEEAVYFLPFINDFLGIYQKIFRTAISKNIAGGVLLISRFNPLMPGGKKRSYILQ